MYDIMISAPYKGLKSWYRQLWVEYFIRTPKNPYNVSIPGYLTSIGHLRWCRWPISKILGPNGMKMSQNGKNRVSEGLKSRYHQLWAEYFIRTSKTPYNASIPGYLPSIGHLRCCGWPISEILGPNCVKVSQNCKN